MKVAGFYFSVWEVKSHCENHASFKVRHHFCRIELKIHHPLNDAEHVIVYMCLLSCVIAVHRGGEQKKP